MPEADAVDVILRLQNLRAFVAGTREAASSVRGIGHATAEANAEARAGVSAGSRHAGVLGLVRKAAIGGGAALALMGVEGVKMATNFDQAMTLIHTQAGASETEVNNLRGQVLQLAQVMPQSPQQLAEGLYHIESIGLRGAKAMDALKVASQGAMVGQANLEDTSTALGSAWLSGIKGAGSLHHTMAILNATVGAGNMRMDDLVHSLGTGILPAAKVAGLGLNDVMSALAILSDEGYQGSSAMAQLGTALHFLYNPTTKAENALQGLHLTGKQLSNTMSGPGGLHGALKLLHDRLQKFGGSAANQKQILGDILPGGRGRVLLVLMNQLDRLEKKQKQIAGTSSRFNEAVKKSHETTANKLRESWSTVQVALINVGHILEPVAVAGARAFSILVVAASKLIIFMVKLPKLIGGLPAPLRIAAQFLGIMAGQALALYAAFRIWGMLRAAFFAVRTGIMAVRGAMILLQMGSGPLMLAIMALVAVAILVITHWKQVGPVLAAIWNWIKGAALTIWGAIKAVFLAVYNVIKGAVMAIVNFVKKYWPILIVILLGPFGIIINLIVRNWALIKSITVGAVRLIIKIVKAVWHALVWVITLPLRLALAAVRAIWRRIHGAVTGAISGIIGFVRAHWRVILIVLTGPLGAAFVWIHDHWNSLLNFFKKLPGRVANIFKDVWHGVTSAFKAAINAVLSIWNSLHFTIGGWKISLPGPAPDVHVPKVTIGMPHVPLLASGGVVSGLGSFVTGEAGPELNTILPGGGVRVQPLSGTKIDTSLSADLHHTTVVQVAGREIARAYDRFSSDKKARE